MYNMSTLITCMYFLNVMEMQNTKLLTAVVCSLIKLRDSGRGGPTIFNPFPPSVPISHRLAKLSILSLEGIIKKFPKSVATMSR